MLGILMEAYLDGQWAPQLIKHHTMQKSEFHFPQCIRSTSSLRMSTGYTGCWPPGRHPGSVLGQHHGHDVDRVHMDLKPNRWGFECCVLRFHSVPGQHRGHYVDRVHMESCTDWEFQPQVFLKENCVSGRPSTGSRWPSTLACKFTGKLIGT